MIVPLPTSLFSLGSTYGSTEHIIQRRQVAQPVGGESNPQISGIGVRGLTLHLSAPGLDECRHAAQTDGDARAWLEYCGYCIPTKETILGPDQIVRAWLA